MSAKARSLRKRLKQKEESEQEQEPANQSNPAAGLKTASTFQETKKNPML